MPHTALNTPQATCHTLLSTPRKLHATHCSQHPASYMPHTALNTPQATCHTLLSTPRKRHATHTQSPGLVSAGAYFLVPPLRLVLRCRRPRLRLAPALAVLELHLGRNIDNGANATWNSQWIEVPTTVALGVMIQWCQH
jgi:hypothetical protein